jgi:hypothetical protein
MKIQIQYGGHQVMKTNNIYFFTNFEKKKSYINNKKIRKRPEQSKQSKFEKQIER